MGLKFVPTELVTIFAAPSIQFYTWHNHFFVQLMWRTGLEAPKDLQFSTYIPFQCKAHAFSKPKGMASALLSRGFPLRYLTYRSTTASAAAVIAAAFSRRNLSGFSDDPSTPPVPQPGPPSPTKSLTDIWIKDPDYRQWKEKEAEMLRDIRPTVQLAKEILHSNRYTVNGFQYEFDFNNALCFIESNIVCKEEKSEGLSFPLCLI